MIGLAPFEALSPVPAGAEVPLPPEIGSIYGPLTFPAHAGRPWVVSNFVTTLDGVVSLAVPGQEGGREISGDNPHDRLLMAILRSVADAVVVGRGTLQASPSHVWTPEHLVPDPAGAFAELRGALGKPGPPLNVIVTGRGDIDPAARLFQTDAVPVLIVTTEQGAERLSRADLPGTVRVAATSTQTIAPRTVLDLLTMCIQPTEMILLEAGPRLTADFLAAHLIDELFLTLSPQIAGRDLANSRPGLAAGHVFAPDDPLWGNLVDTRRAGDHLFLRYALP